MSVPNRTSRTARRYRRRRAAVAGVGVLVLVVAAVGVVTVLDGSRDTPDAVPSDANPGSGNRAPSALLALAVTGGDVPLVAVVGSGEEREPAALVLPSEMIVTVPGAGEVPVGAAGSLAADSMHVAVSNVVGTWTEAYASLELQALRSLVGQVGGLTVDLPALVTLAGTPLGPGPTEMTGEQVAAYVGAPGADSADRWAAVLEALLAQETSLARVRAASGDKDAADAIWSAARGAAVEVPVTETLAGTVIIPAQPELDTQIGDLFGTPSPTPALVQNGSGMPGVGEDVAALIIPEGFRIVLSTNAESFDHERTEVVAIGPEHRDAARVVHGALGVGVVRVAQVPSGLADVTIVVGKDFQA